MKYVWLDLVIKFHWIAWDSHKITSEAIELHWMVLALNSICSNWIARDGNTWIDLTEPAQSCRKIDTPQQVQTTIEVQHTGTPNKATKQVWEIWNRSHLGLSLTWTQIWYIIWWSSSLSDLHSCMWSIGVFVICTPVWHHGFTFCEPYISHLWHNKSHFSSNRHK